MVTVDMTGREYGAWTVLRRGQRTDSTGKVYWECRCRCGNVTEIEGSRLRSKQSLQCAGCRKTHNRSNRVIAWRGKEWTMAEWSRQTGLASPTLYGRLRAGRSLREVLSDGADPEVLDKIGPDDGDPVEVRSQGALKPRVK